MFIIHDKNMNRLELPKGVTPLDIFISSIDKERVTERLEGKHGSVDYGFTYNSRSIDLNILLKANDTKDYRLLRDAVYSFFHMNDEVYVSESYQPGKRYLISIDNQYIPDRIPNNQRFAEAEVTCTKLGLPFAESIGTTQDIQREGINSNSELWGFGMGLESVDESLLYNHTAFSDTDFLIYNAGNILVHPFEQELKIVIDNVVGATDKFELKNKTNGTVFRVNEFINRNQKIMLDGANVTSNGMQFLRSTNKGFIELDPGYNLMTITGARRADIMFDFRFYYS